MTINHQHMKHRKDFTEHDKLLIATQYTRLSDTTLGKRIGATAATVRRYRKANGLEVNERHKANKCRMHCNPPAFKGADHYKHTPEGTVRVHLNKGRPFKAVKIGGRWIRYSRYQYERHKGAIPPHWVVVHLDGDPMNCEPDNLKALDKTEFMRGKWTEDTLSEMRNSKRRQAILKELGLA